MFATPPRSYQISTSPTSPGGSNRPNSTASPKDCFPKLSTAACRSSISGHKCCCTRLQTQASLTASHRSQFSASSNIAGQSLQRTRSHENNRTRHCSCVHRTSSSCPSLASHAEQRAPTAAAAVGLHISTPPLLRGLMMPPSTRPPPLTARRRTRSNCCGASHSRPTPINKKREIAFRVLCRCTRQRAAGGPQGVVTTAHSTTAHSTTAQHDHA